ncbi:glycosyltransferase family 4 protein [Sphingosinicellaceae bacterium]|nr:glycosyltransferase family 4 protein [Sphingosinicellaceae bacterium]
MTRPRVLLLAEVANPEFVSVPLIAWSLSEAIGRNVDAHMVTHVRNRDAILRQGWREGEDFTILDTEWATRRIWDLARLLGGRDNKGWTIHQALAPLGCFAFEETAWRRFKPDLLAGRFDIVHRITPMSPTTPSLLGRRLKRLGIPFVVGPLNGGVPWPPGFQDRMRREREALSYLRSAFKLIPGYRAMRRDAAALLSGSLFTLSEMPASAAPRSFYFPENGIDPARFDKSRTRAATLPLRGAFIGRLVPYKAADVLIRAAEPLLRSGKLHLDIIGDGPERDSLAAQVAGLGLESQVTLHGNIEHRSVQDILSECDFLACPSVREFGGGVVLEAMALGVVPIVADYGGQTELLDDQCGIRIPFTDVASLECGFREALDGLARDPARLDAMGVLARQRIADHFTWERKAAKILKLYDWCLYGGNRPVLDALPAVHSRVAEPQALRRSVLADGIVAG